LLTPEFAWHFRSLVILRENMRNPRRTALLTVGSALLAVAPKCPVCFLAYFGIFGVTAASASAYRAWLPPLTAIWLALTVGLLFVRTKGWRRYGPAAAGFVAAIVIFTAKFVTANPRAVYAGIATLVAATVWSSWLRTSEPAPACSDCEPLQSRMTVNERESPA
jgi:drug/metabolite transporter (DMT)-like permease